MNGRRINPTVKYNNQAITADIAPFITDISFTDNLSGQADDITINLGDRERKWINNWAPKKGASLEVSLLISADWQSNQAKNRDIGYFEIDQLSTSGPPNKVSVKGTSVPQGTSLNGQEKSHSWEKTTLKNVLQYIADRNKLKLYFSATDNPSYDTMEQDNETDLAFMLRICNDAGMSLKIQNKTITVLDDAKLESAAIVTTVSWTDPGIESYNGTDNLSGTYKACTVSYQNAKQKKTLTYTFTPPTPPKTDRVLFVNEEVTSLDQAKLLAKKKLREANKDATTFSITKSGFLNLYSGQTINLSGFGMFDGKYIITSFGGAIGNNSTTSLELRKCLEGY